MSNRINDGDRVRVMTGAYQGKEGFAVLYRDSHAGRGECRLVDIVTEDGETVGTVFMSRLKPVIKVAAKRRFIGGAHYTYGYLMHLCRHQISKVKA